MHLFFSLLNVRLQMYRKIYRKCKDFSFLAQYSTMSSGLLGFPVYGPKRQKTEKSAWLRMTIIGKCL